MSPLKKGPGLKLPEVKVPDFLLDLYYDLRERHLLPLVAVLAVAIVAVPIALSQSGGSSSPEVAGENAVGAPSVAPPSGSGGLVVAKAAPGLRDYRRRLGNLHSKDPFRQQYAGPAAATAEVTSTSASSMAATSGGESSVSLSATSAPSTSTANVTTGPISSGGATTKGETQTKYASDTIDVRIIRVDSASDRTASSKAEPTVRRNVPELTMLPGRDTPVAVFMGASSDGKKALLLVSSDVRSVFGDARCVVGSQVCQLLALEPGLPETFVFGPQGRAYRIEILKIDHSLSDKPHRASLGEPKKNKP
jgi:hypothetical protein